VLARHANPPLTATVYAGLTERGREQLGAKLAEAFGAYTDARGPLLSRQHAPS
jgi:hypothetical protein